MPLRIITADERLAQRDRRKVTMCIFGRAKIGKTSLILTLPPEETLLFDFESGDFSIPSEFPLAVQLGPIRTWPDALNAICLVAGPDPARIGNETFSTDHYQFVCAENAAGRLFGRTIDLAPINYVYFDSITDLTRVAMLWAGQQPEAFSDKKPGARDLRGQYGLLGREVVQTLKHVQHVPDKSVFFVGGLDRRIDDFGRETFEPQTEGQKIGSEIPFITDHVVTLSDFDYSPDIGWTHNFGKGQYRMLCCKSPNPWGLPAGTRAGTGIEVLEEAHLGHLISKIRKFQHTNLVYGRPDQLVTAN